MMPGDMMKKYIRLLLCTVAAVMFLVRIISGNEAEFSEASYIQPVIELMLICYGLLTLMPWISDKIRNSTVKDMTETGILFGVVALLVLLVPEYTDSDRTIEERLSMMAIFIGIYVSLSLVYYAYQRWIKKKAEIKEGESDDMS